MRIGGRDSVREVHASATVFIPADASISVTHIGSDAISVAFLFSAPGAVSIRDAEKNVQLSKVEEDDR
jgi:5-deoxy-D-glucuronate isomerase